MFVYILLLCFLPALFVFVFIKLFKNKLAKNPTKHQLVRYVLLYLFLVVCVGCILYGLSQLT